MKISVLTKARLLEKLFDFIVESFVIVEYVVDVEPAWLGAGGSSCHGKSVVDVLVAREIGVSAIGPLSEVV